jgi:tetratricopeptide (TPR) repeat protein
LAPKEPEEKNIRKDVAEFMYLISTRNSAAIEKATPVLIASLENQSDPAHEALLFFVKGATSFFRNNYEEAKIQLKKIFDLPLKDSDLHGIGYMGLGLTNRSAGQVDEAVTCLFQATELIGTTGPFKTFLVYCFQQLGDIHVAINDYENAVVYFTNAFDHRTGDNDSIASFRYHMGLGTCFLKMKDHQKSEYHLLKAQEIRDVPPPMISRVENDLGDLYLEMGEYDKAEKLLSSSIAIREAHKLEDAACTSMTSLAEVYSWTTIIVMVVISELFLDPIIENYAYNNVLSLWSEGYDRVVV